MRQKFEFASTMSHRPGRSVWQATLLLLALLAVPGIGLAQDKPPEDAPADDPNRKAANISWNPQTTYAEWKNLEKVRFIEFDSKLKAASLSEAEKKPLLKHLTNQINGLTVEQNVDRHAIIVENIARACEQVGTSPAARDFLFENILKQVEPLLKNQPPNVQYSLVLLVARLNAKPADQAKRIPAQPYPGSQQILMKVLMDELMPISARIMAVHGLDRLMRDGDISTVEKSNIGVALAKALGQKVENPLARKWYRRRVVSALGVTGRYEDVGYRPFMIDALMEVITNPKDDWEVRAAAARAGSQLPLDNKVNVELVNYEIVRLLHDLAVAYTASDKTPPSMWRWSFDDIYLAYKSATAAEQNTRHWGLMHLNTPRGRDQINSAYKVVLPVLKPVLESQALPTLDAKAVKAAEEWLKANNVNDRKVTPGSGDLKAPQAAAPQAAAIGAGNAPGK